MDDMINKAFAANLEVIDGSESKQQADLLAILHNCTIAGVAAIFGATEALRESRALQTR